MDKITFIIVIFLRCYFVCFPFMVVGYIKNLPHYKIDWDNAKFFILLYIVSALSWIVDMP